MTTTNPSALHPNPSAAALPYNPALSLWLSVDPMSDKYPNLSPYVYCANNPVRLVDVDGRDVYDFDEKGNLINRVENKEADIIRVVNRRGNEISSKTYNYGTILEAENNNMNSDKTFLSIKDNASRTNIFEQLASNTKVEWATINAKRVKNGVNEEINYISTSGSDIQNTMTQLASKLYTAGFTATECTLSHPKNFFGINCPSGYGFLGDQVKNGDRKAFIEMRKMWNNVVVKVFDANNRHYYELGATKDDIIDINCKGERNPYNPYGQ